MKRMARAGILNEYLSKKYDTKITFEDEEPIREIDDSDMHDDLDVDDINVDWNEEIKKYL